jgi:hypothetical protein
MNRHLPAIATVAFGLAITGAAPVFAQLNANGTGMNQVNGALQHNMINAQPNGAKGQGPAPPVLPGTKAPSEAVAPTALPADMTPSEALFDAINRGDLPGARDAMNRGAQLEATNVLGLTPLELSVDLGRNDISFMLMSMRGDSAAARQTARVGTQDGRPPRTEARARVIASSSREPAEEPVTATPRYESGNGGSPIPAAGFLGFNGGRAGR